MHADFLFERFRAAEDRDAVAWRGKAYSYGWLLERCRRWAVELEGLPPGAVVSLEADFSPNSVALFLALIAKEAILVPITSSVSHKRERFLEIAQTERGIAIDDADAPSIRPLGRTAGHPLYGRLRSLRRPGLVLFSSGSTGESKAAVHDFAPLLDKFRVQRHSRRGISFLLYDHIGGVNTMLYVLSNGGCLVTVPGRDPDTVLKTVQDSRAELLPTSPTFLNLALLSEAFRRYDLASLRTVTYGTEPMSASTLERVHRELPHVELLQTYGLSEVGILRSKSRGPDSLWVKIGGEGFETRVVDGILHIKAKSAMLGYLNAPSPFTDDGWLNTGDAVDVDGEWLRILGRKSEIINVGGEKAYPAEVESVLQTIPNVAEVAVYGEKNALTGQAVAARFRLIEPEDPAAFRNKVRAFCRGKLRPFQIPARIAISEEAQHGGRFKKIRREDGPDPKSPV
jgi:long-chain acyl-CoA synthetase